MTYYITEPVVSFICYLLTFRWLNS